jgi:hypothetical protein
MKRIGLFVIILLLPLSYLIHDSNCLADEINSDKSSYLKEYLCGTADIAKSKMPAVRPPNGPEYVITTHFLIHYDITGPRAVNLFYAQSVANYAEDAWADLTNLGWAMPPPDGSNGGSSNYDIYIDTVLAAGGYCSPEESYPDPYPEGMTSWIKVPPDFSEFSFMKAVVYHEFHHACQGRYNHNLESFFDNTSVFIADKLTDWPDISNLLHGSSPNPLDCPYYPINSETTYRYPGGLWARFLDEYYDINSPTRILRIIWEHFGVSGSETSIYPYIHNVLFDHYSSSLEAALGHYAIWRYFCGSRNDGFHFAVGDTYSEATILRSHTTYPASGDQGTSNPSGPGGCNFIRFTNLGDNRITIYFDGQGGYAWAAYVLGIGSDHPYEQKILLEPSQDTGRITIPGWQFTELVLVPVVTQWQLPANNLTYNYTVTRTPAFDVPADGVLSQEERILSPMLQIQPNPFKSQTTIRYMLPANSINTSLEIYDATGRLVTSHQPTVNNNCFIWDGKDTRGRDIKNGVYFCCLTTDNQTIKKRITVLR